MEKSMILAGFGGQGILSMGRLICRAAEAAGLNATFFPSYGGEQRGGTCNCTLVLSDEEIGSPITSRADYIAVMNEPSYIKFKNSALSGGTLLINRSQVAESEAPEGVEVRLVDADDLAEKAGGLIASNMVMLGAITRASEFLPADTVERVLRDEMKSKPKYLETNIAAFKAGLE